MTLAQSILCALASNPMFVRNTPSCGLAIEEQAIKEATVRLVKIAESIEPTPNPATRRETPLVTATDLEFYSRSAAYREIDVIDEFHQFEAWCGANTKQPSKARFVNWLNRAARNAAIRNRRYGPAVQLSPSVERMSLERQLKEATDALNRIKNASPREQSESDYAQRLKDAVDRVNDLRKRLNG